jgi:branched-chain amino acid transport system permease protein
MQMPAVTQIGQVLAAGITNGSIYALVALGFSLIFSVSRYLNLLQGEFVVLGALVTIALTKSFGVPILLAAMLAIAATCAFGFLFQRLTLSPVRNLTPDTALMVTLGGAFIARGGAMVLFGKEPLALPSFSSEQPVVVAAVVLSTQSFWIVGVLLAASASLWLFSTRTYFGKAMRACAQSPTGARLVGIDLRHMAFVSFLVSAALGAVAGIVSAPLTFVSYDDGLAMGIKGFIAAVFGGLGSYIGAVVGGIVLGVGEELTAAFISSQFKDAVAFVGLLVLLLAKPSGLMGGR